MTELGPIIARKICWPDPDATCLEGGCGYCEDGVWRAISTLRRYAEGAGILLNRGIGEKPATAALDYGLSREFGNVPVRRAKP